MTSDRQLVLERFPRAAKYHPTWILASVSGAANPLWLSEWLAEAINFRPGMRVLDLGCGRAASSIFLRREYGVQVWATDLWFSVAENMQRIRDAGVEDGVFPIHADARSLPFAPEFFDAIVCIDCFPYFGTDDLYLSYIARFVKNGGLLGIVGAGLTREMDDRVPEHLREWWTPDLWCLHTAQWWRRHWERTDILHVDVCDAMPDGWQLWLDWLKVIAPDNQSEIKALEADHGTNLGYVRLVGCRQDNVKLADPIESVPTHYARKPLLSGES